MQLRAQTWADLQKHNELFLEESAVIGALRCMIEKDALQEGPFQAGSYECTLQISGGILFVTVYTYPCDSFEIRMDPDSKQLYECTALRAIKAYGN